VISTTRKAGSDYQSAYPEPLNLKAGDNVTVADKKTEWPGWIWCTDGSGNSGWVPADYVEREGAAGTLGVDYDATELSVKTGDEVQVLKEQSGWAWCRKRTGDLGWLPLKVLEG
jgi:uncharacterized protein YgiM (DUF1202 family)